MSAKRKKHNHHIFLKLLLLLIILCVAAYYWIANKSSGWTNYAKEIIASDTIPTDTQYTKSNISISDIPNNLKNAYISIEDQRFYSHFGVDLKRTGGAIFTFVINEGTPSYGGSTITQQLVKNITGDNEDTAERKIKEWYKAIALERVLSKEEILEAYLNIIYLGPGIYGVDQASHFYFNKQVKDLSLAECAFIAGLTHSPNSYNPFKPDSDFEKIKHRTKTVLAKMLELKHINQTEYDQAITEVEKGLHFEKNNSSYV